MNINKTPVQSYSLLGQVSVSDKSLGATYPQPIATSNLGPKIQQRESCETADTKKTKTLTPPRQFVAKMLASKPKQVTRLAKTQMALPWHGARTQQARHTTPQFPEREREPLGTYPSNKPVPLNRSIKALILPMMRRRFPA